MAWITTASFNPSSLTGPYVAGGGAATSPRPSAYPDWALLRKTARILAFRNATTAEGCTAEGRAIEASFWLVDPPGVSYFSVHCPGLQEEDFSGEPQVVCAEAAFVLFRVSFSFPTERRISTHHFVYTARGTAGAPSLQLLPEPPGVEAVKSHRLGLLPRGGEHYAVAFLDRNWTARDDAWQWQFDAYVFSSETCSWSKKEDLLGLSESDAALLRPHATSKQIAVGASTLGWVDISRGITLLCDLFDECPVVKYIPLPVPGACITPYYRLTRHSAQCFHDVACYDGLIKFVEVGFDEPDCMIKGKGWRATTWIRNISWGGWRKHTRVDVGNISVDPRYSALLPELWNHETHKLELKKLVFLLPTLSVRNDDLLYIMAKVGGEHDKAWVIAVDMKSAVVEGLAPVSTGRYCPSTMFSPCAFPSYLNNMTQGNKSKEPLAGCNGGILEEEEIQAEHKIRGPDMGNPVDKYFKRMSASQCALQVLMSQRWFRELDEWLDSQGSACDACCKSLPYWCPASALCFDIKAVVNYASYNGEGEGASMAVDSCLRALNDFYKLLEQSTLSDPSTIEAMKRQIMVALGALDSILEFVPLNRMPRSIQKVLVDVCLEQKEKTLVCEHCEKPGHTEDESDEWQQRGSGSEHESDGWRQGSSDSEDESDEWGRGSSDSGDESDEWRRVGSDSDDSLETRGEKQAHAVDRRSRHSYWLYFVGCILVAVAAIALSRLTLMS
ncbi:hypothetical protein D1007_19433 [Hordeum vulgare]|nr:hypothetical protein D1007_19433 [Hordeum vulgare]